MPETSNQCWFTARYPGFDYHNPPVMEPYRPFCDFAPWAQCSVVLMSPPGRILRYLGLAKPAAGATGKLDRLRPRERRDRCCFRTPASTLISANSGGTASICEKKQQ